jgi:hypothetical protein
MACCDLATGLPAAALSIIDARRAMATVAIPRVFRRSSWNLACARNDGERPAETSSRHRGFGADPHGRALIFVTAGLLRSTRNDGEMSAQASPRHCEALLPKQSSPSASDARKKLLLINALDILFFLGVLATTASAEARRAKAEVIQLFMVAFRNPCLARDNAGLLQKTKTRHRCRGFASFEIV